MTEKRKDQIALAMMMFGWIPFIFGLIYVGVDGYPKVLGGMFLLSAGLCFGYSLGRLFSRPG